MGFDSIGWELSTKMALLPSYLQNLKLCDWEWGCANPLKYTKCKRVASGWWTKQRGVQTQGSLVKILGGLHSTLHIYIIHINKHSFHQLPIKGEHVWNLRKQLETSNLFEISKTETNMFDIERCHLVVSTPLVVSHVSVNNVKHDGSSPRPYSTSGRWGLSTLKCNFVIPCV